MRTVLRFAEPTCAEQIPQLEEVKPGRWVACPIVARDPDNPPQMGS